MSGEGSLRIDKWLWAARFFKTRALAAEAIDAGRVSVNGERAKASKVVRPGDAVRVRRPPFEHAVKVLGVADRRGPASEARGLYEETPESRAAREALTAELRSMPPPAFKGRPTKRDRRTLERFMRGQDED